MADFVNQETVKKWQNRVGKAEPDLRRTVERVGERMLNVSRRHMEEQIYSIPEDVTKAGKKKWVRTGTLKQGEKLEFAPDGSGVTLTNTIIYAHARHELGRDGRQTKRPAHWREGIIQELRDSTQRELQVWQQRILRGEP